MKLHEIKLLKQYAKPKQYGLKPFEIRKNDRGYQVGDLIRYSVPDDENLNKIFNRTIYQIMYITDYEQKEGYIVFSDRYLTTIENLWRE